MAQKDLRRVRAAARRLEKAQAALRDAIYAASRSGESTRDIAPYAGMSHSQVAERIKEAARAELERTRPPQE